MGTSTSQKKWISTAFICMLGVWGFSASANEVAIEHDLDVELIPAEQKLIGIDRMRIYTDSRETLVFRLAESADHVSVAVNSAGREFSRQGEFVRVPLNPAEQHRILSVTIGYSAIFDDPVPFRPVNTDNPGFGVSATISERGSFLLSGAHWYPELIEARCRYNLTVRAPAGMIAVTAGQSLGRATEAGITVSRWKTDHPTEGLALSVGPYVVHEKKVGNVTAATYFLSPDPQLSAAYLEATANYLSFFADLFGPYPFSKFAVVENFFPTGYGFSSYTLMGGSVLRLPFIIETSLGHEIAHCWWGNAVYVDYESGNWSEALTTYVSDYLFQERKSESQARDYRLQLLRNYATLVTPQNDFALSDFISRSDPVTKTIGYDKGAMVFHMLRKMLGEEAFWGALRDIYRQRQFRSTAWSDLQTAFEQYSHGSLQAFFDQWIYREGAPRFYLESVNAERSNGKWNIRGRVVQQKPCFAFPLTLMVASSDQKIFKNIPVPADTETFFELSSDHAPERLALDPNVDIMRRLHDAEIPPSINSLKGSPSILFLLSNTTGPELKKAAEILGLSLGLKTYDVISESEARLSQLGENDLVIVGNPQNKDLLRRMPDQTVIAEDTFSINQRLYSDESHVFFGVFPHPFADDRVTALFWSLAAEKAEMIARKITHYGKYSYIVFQNSQNQDKGIWPTTASPLVHRWAR